MFNQPLITFSILILWSVHGSWAEPNEFTYVAFGTDFIGTDTTDPGVIDTISVMPIGTASGVTTYLWDEVIEAVGTDTLSSQTVTTTIAATFTGTLVASASGFAVTVDVLAGGQVQGTEVAECHYTDSVSGECSGGVKSGTTIINGTTISGPAITRAVAEAAPTNSSSPSASASNNGGMPYIEFNVGILIGMGVSTLAGACITTWI
ncbi:hypothetical protein BDP27DRAFT_1466551 [Rhodocollybia butyracea]|uniref:Uncharacterized protein n=1 Tax=Rhodocollybia butyracea TaxID=206335 RepID=A0A9P5U2U1_9AGAR|nr:hypothetical protein BDP27DRAFT_1466551 [Rhodocollybia butyracea]